MAAEFKIGRLRYTWSGPWTTATVYQRDAVVSFSGQTYVCLTPHTSSSFVTDLASSIWSLSINGTQWKQAWAPSTQYFVGNIVRYGGEMYICIVAHTSGLTQIDTPNWTVYSLFDNWQSAWTTNKSYGVGDVVKYGAVVYRCNANHVSNQYYEYASYSGASVAFSATGLEADQSKWDIVYSGTEFKGSWSTANYRYRLNDVVKNGPDQWICTAGHVSTTTFGSSQWAIYMPGFEFANTWNAGSTYQPGDVVAYGGYSYINNLVNNTNINPSTDAVNWSVVSSGYEALGQWGVDFTGFSKLNYKIGDVVRRGGLLFIALQDSTNQDPSAGTVSLIYNPAGSSGTTVKVTSTANVAVGMVLTGTGFTLGQQVVQVVDATTLLLNNPPDGTPLAPPSGTLAAIGINYTYWNLLSFGLNYRGIWQINTQYLPNDIVVYQNKTYKAIVSNNSTTSPILDVTSSIWTTYLPHAIRNAMNSQGDMVTYRAGVPSALPITTAVTVGSTTTNVPMVDYLLRLQPDANGVLYPTWSQFNITPKVYYVATTGTDRSDYGVTYDRPWKTIAYACSQVLNGTSNPIASSILTANKEYMAQEVYQWMKYQSNNNNAPFSTTSVFDQTKTLRDTRYIIDAIIYDITRGGNSQTVAVALSYFAPGSTNTLVSTTVTAEIAYFVAAVVRLKVLLDLVINKLPVSPSYQALNSVATPVAQVTAAISRSVETGAQDSVDTLIGIVIQALQDQSTSNIPTANAGLTSNIFIKTGTYSEILPISVPENTALVGDELRGVVVQPLTRITTTAIATSATGNTISLSTVTGLTVGMPIQFSGTAMIGGLGRGATYYVATVNTVTNIITIAGTSNLTLVQSVTDGAGSMTVYAGDCLKNMFLVRNGSGIRNMSTTGLLGFLTDLNPYLTRRPTGGAYVSLDPGTGTDDTSAWIFRRSPYIQNVTTFGIGCVGLKIDGSLHNGGNKSIVANDFTQVLSDGIGVWCTGTSALTECVSVFTYYNYTGYLAENGGRIRATNGNSSYGTFGVLSEGYDLTETPISGIVFNQSSQVQASVQSSFGVSANLLKMQYANGGSGYYSTTTNLLYNSNLFSGSGWVNDGNLTLQQNLTGPFGNTDGWTLSGNSSGTDGSYVYQNTAIQPAAGYYTSVGGTTTVGGVGASGALFNITVGATSYSVVTTPGQAGTGYSINNQILIYGNQLGGVSGVNDLTITVISLSGGTGVGNVSISGVVPTGSDLKYTFSIYVKQGTSPSIDLLARYSGASIVDSLINYNFNTGIITPRNSSGGYTPTSYGKVVLTNGWFRLWFTTYDVTAQNTNVQFRIYPRTQFGSSAYSYVFGAQTQISSALTFYLQTSSTSRYSAYANYFISGSGSGASVVGDETRSNAIFETRVSTDSNGVTGGANYITASNNAQGGTSSYVILAQSDNNTASNYIGARVFINSGTGAGQYGYISAYTPVNKYAYVLKESFTPLSIVSSTSSANSFTIIGSQSTNTLYVNQPVQFIPTYYTTTVTATGNDSIEVTQTIGGTTNTLTVSSTAKLAVGQAVIFTGSNLYGNITAGYYFYIKTIPSATTFTISATPAGTAWGLTNGTSTLLSGAMILNFPSNTSFLTGTTTNMLPNMPIQFTGTSIGGVAVGTPYYVNRVISATSFSLSTILITISPTTTTASSKQITVTSTATLISLTPIRFSGTLFGGLVAGTTYFISRIVDSTNFKIASNVIEVRVTATEVTTNLITASNTTGFIVGNPITFSGTTFGGLSIETIYYVLAINTVGVNGTFTISSTPVISPNIVQLQTGAGDMLCRTADADFAVQDGTGSSMTGTSTGPKKTLTYGSGTMNGTYSTSVFGGVTQAQIYYVRTIAPGNVPNTFTVTTSSGGAIDFANSTDSGSMNLAMSGWDHINPGTPIVASLDSTSLYYIEPRTTYSTPNFSQSSSNLTTQTIGNSYVSVAYGNGLFIAVPNATSVASQSTDGNTWTSMTLPTSATWSGIAYGNGYWVIISSAGTGSSTALFSNSAGASWRSTSLPSVSTYTAIVYGNGYFVTICSNPSGANSYASGAYSTDFGKTWTGNALPVLGGSTAWTSLAHGAGKFVAVASGGTLGAISTGTSWASITLPTTGNWSSIAFGNNRFVAVSSSSVTPIYSFDGTTWYQSPYAIQATKIAYGQGVFVAVNSGSISGYTSEDGVLWTARIVSSDTYGAIAFGFDSSRIGKFITASGTNTGSSILAGAIARGRALITSGTITGISMWETGSNYTTTPTITFTDPNITTVAVVTPRVASGALSGPTFISRGSGYNTNSTTIIINGDGYSDSYQTGYTLILNNLSRLPSPGDNLSIVGNNLIYKVTSSTAMLGTVAPNIEANVQISPAMTTALSPANNTSISIRTKYSQVRLTNHDFLNIGYGNKDDSNYPGVPVNTTLASQNQAVESNNGRVFYTSTDQDGNFKVGNLFGVQQSTGIITLSASQFGLTGLNQLTLGGIAVGGSSVVVQQFSTDATFLANSDVVIPTQKAIKSFLTSKLSQGGSNTFTSVLTAGLVIAGGPAFISNTIPQGVAGSSVVMLNKVNINGQYGGIDGNMIAMEFFIKCGVHR